MPPRGAAAPNLESVRLEITRSSDLATRALLTLAGAGRMKGPDLAAEVGTTAGFLSQVLAPLVAAGWVRSETGRLGGYELEVDLDALSVLDVIEAIEGPTDQGRCVLVDRACASTDPCALHVAWHRSRALLVEQLAGSPLSEVAAQSGAAP